ncbi:Glutamate/aspartate transport system permease protein GltK [compost metagenome]
MGHGQSLLLIILPQAWLAIIPPLVSQIVNIIKNSSLAIAVGFPDLLWSLTTVIGVTNRTVESVLLLFVLYLFPSLAASWLLSVLNRRLLAPRRGA